MNVKLPKVTFQHVNLVNESVSCTYKDGRRTGLIVTK